MKLKNLGLLFLSLLVGGYGFALIIPFYKEYTLLDLISFSEKTVLPLLGLFLISVSIHGIVLYGQRMNRS